MFHMDGQNLQIQQALTIVPNTKRSLFEQYRICDGCDVIAGHLRAGEVDFVATKPR